MSRFPEMLRRVADDIEKQNKNHVQIDIEGEVEDEEIVSFASYTLKKIGDAEWPGAYMTVTRDCIKKLAELFREDIPGDQIELVYERIFFARIYSYMVNTVTAMEAAVKDGEERMGVDRISLVNALLPVLTRHWINRDPEALTPKTIFEALRGLVEDAKKRPHEVQSLKGETIWTDSQTS